MSLLHLSILIPIIAAAAVLLGAPARKFALGATVLNLLLTLYVFTIFDRSAEGFQLIGSIPVLDYGAIKDLKLLVGVDGLNLVLLLLTAIVSVAAVLVSPKVVDRNPSAYYASILFIVAGAVGAFASLDIFFFYIFHELALIPTFLMIGIWGNGDRQAAAWKITLYLALGSFILLIGLIAFYWSLPEGLRTFDMIKLLEARESGLLSVADQYWIYPILLVGFGILISLFPFHSWAPGAYASAPTATTMLHAGVLKKFGLYGLIRLTVPLLPDGVVQWANVLLILLLCNILYIGFVTIAQRRLDLMLGYSSVMHMGYIFLGIVALNSTGIGGATMLMFAHGISIALLFALSGEIFKRTGSLEFEDLGGLMKNAPFLGVIFGFAAFASIGLPGFANFPGELLVFFGAFSPAVAEAGLNTLQIGTIFALWGLVISAIYMLRAYRNIFFGEAPGRCAGAHDCGKSVRLPILLLLFVLLATGVVPNVILELASQAMQMITL